jgi:hypothetical protein
VKRNVWTSSRHSKLEHTSLLTWALPPQLQWSHLVRWTCCTRLCTVR